MLDAGVPVYSIDEFGQTAFMYAASKNKTDVVRLILQNGADANNGDRADCTPLHFAARENSTAAIAVLMQNYASTNITSKKVTNESILHI